MQLVELEYYRGDTWLGMTVSTLINGVTPAVAAASARLQFRKDTAIEELSSVNGKLVITNPTDWIFSFPPTILTNIISPGQWDWDLEVTDVNGRVQTILRGILGVTEDVTR